MLLKQYIRRIAASVLRRPPSESAPNGVQLKMACTFTSRADTCAESLPDGYELRSFRCGDEDDWLRFINQTGSFGVLDEEYFTHEILQTLIPGGGQLLIKGHEIVGCASACRLRAYLPHATLMYVVVSADERGRGLGRALTYAAMRVARQAGYTGLVLNTDDKRIPAIRTYLSAGFVPHLLSEFDHSARWSAVMREIESRVPPSTS
jgi:mycothiol synthase